MRITCDWPYHDAGEGVCVHCVRDQIKKAKEEECQRVILALEEYGRTDMTLSRLGELLNQSPPVLRILIGRAAARANDSAVDLPR
jgi:hypothetical protein